MTSDARAEAERRYPQPQHDSETYLASERARSRRTFIAGAQYIEDTRVKELEAALARKQLALTQICERSALDSPIYIIAERALTNQSAEFPQGGDDA